MYKKQKIIITSLSDCREKNGVVTFMEILSRHASCFVEHGMELVFANYVDLLPTCEGASSPILTKHAQASTNTALHVPTLQTRCKRKAKNIIKSHPFGAFFIFLSTLGARGLVTAIKAHRYEEPDSVYFYQDFLTAFFGCFLHHKAARRVIILHSGDDALSQLFSHFPSMIGTRYESLIRRGFDWTLRHQQTIIALSEKYASDLRKQYTTHEVKCIYNTSPFAGTRPVRTAIDGSQDRIKLVAVGTLQYRKGFDMLINAVASLPQAARDKLDVTIVGGGPSHVELHQLIQHYGLSNGVRLVGESDNVADFLASSHAYILTSRDEGLPISLIEACSFGLPIISTQVGSIPEISDDHACRLINASEDSIAEALLDLCVGKLDLEHLSVQSRNIFESKLSLEKFLGEYINLLSNNLAVKP